jgi:iron complex outermembrane receptor protein
LPPQPVETVIVTGVYEPIPLEESDRSVTVLVIAQEHDVLFNDPTGFLRLDPTVDLQARGPNNIQTDVSIRGGTFGQTLVLWNGLRLNDAQTGHHDLDTPIPLESVDRVEILKGAGSTLYGSDAVGGVVNFISRPPEISEVRLRTSVGNFGVNQQHVELTLLQNGWTEDLTADRDFSSGFRFDRDYRDLSIASLSHHNGSLGATDIMLAISDRPFGADQFYGDYPSWERTKSWFAGIRQTFGASTEVDLGYRRHTDLFVLYRDQPQAYTNRHVLDTYQGALRRRRRLGGNTELHYGTDGSYDSIQSSNLGAHTRGRAAAFGAVDFRALGRFSLNLGAREEVYRGLRHQFSSSVTGGLWVSPRLRLRGGVSHAFRLPSFTELYYHDPATIGSPNLQPEQAWSSEVAAEWRPAGRILAQTTLFQRRERNDIDYVRESASDPWQAANLGRLRATGVEASLQIPLHESDQLTLSYTGMRLRTDSEPGLLTEYTSNYPVHNGTLNYQGTFARLFLLRTRLGVLQRTGRDPYPLWEVAVARARGRIRPYVQFANLTNTAYQEIPGVPMPGRAVVGGIEIRAKLK